MTEVFILSAVRTPIGRFGGSLAGYSAAELGAQAAHAAWKRAGVAAEAIELCIFGNARQAGGGPNPARQIVRLAGLPDEVPGYTINQACASGLKAVEAAALEIRLGRAACIVAGGTEAMSRIPYLAPRARWGQRMGHTPMVDAMYQDGYHCPLCDLLMGETAELLAGAYGISRREQDEFALASHQKAAQAAAAGLGDELIAVEGSAGKLKVDEHVRPKARLEDFEGLEPAFKPAGSITAGNASGITDGAAALVLASGDFRQRHALPVMGRWLESATAALAPERMGLGPAPAIARLLRHFDGEGARLDHFDSIEINEAFAAQVLACLREPELSGLPRERLNPGGGAIALGHPTGCRGARILVTLLHTLRRRGGGRGLAALCAAGGMGMAAAVEVR